MPKLHSMNVENLKCALRTMCFKHKNYEDKKVFQSKWKSKQIMAR
jgi:hypothetical protein